MMEYLFDERIILALYLSIVSHNQTTFLLSYLDGKKKGLVNALYIFALKIPTFWGIYMWLLMVLKDRKT